MDIRLVVCDIDDTLIDQSAQIPAQIIDIIKKLNKNGIYFSLATGRNLPWALPVAEQLGITTPYIVSNGACIFRGDKSLIKHSFPILPLMDIICTADELGLTVTVSDAYKEWVVQGESKGKDQQNSIDNRFSGPRNSLDLSSLNSDNNFFQKLQFYREDSSQQIQVLRQLLQPFSDDYSIITYPRQSIEIGPMGCSKATGLTELAKLLQVPMDDVMACGDYVNDVEMLREAGIGVAVGNASRELKEVADFVANADCAYGVIEAIKHYSLI